MGYILWRYKITELCTNALKCPSFFQINFARLDVQRYIGTVELNSPPCEHAKEIERDGIYFMEI